MVCHLQASSIAEQTREDGEAALDTDAGVRKDAINSGRPEISAAPLPATSDEQPGADASAESGHALGPCEYSEREEHPSRVETSEEESIHGCFPEDDLNKGSAQVADRLAAQDQAGEASGGCELALARQEPSAELSYSDLTALLSSSKGEAHEPDEVSSSGGGHEEAVIQDVPNEDSQPSSTSADDRLSAGDAADQSQSEGHEPGLMASADASATQQMTSELQPHPPAVPNPSDQRAEDVEPPALGPFGAVSNESVAEDGSTGQDRPRPDSHADDANTLAPQNALSDRAHITPPPSARKARLPDAADPAADARPPAVQQSGVTPEIREFLASQGLQHILGREQMDLPASQGEDLGDPLSPREHGSLTDANFLEVSHPFHGMLHIHRTSAAQQRALGCLDIGSQQSLHAHALIFYLKRANLNNCSTHFISSLLQALTS